jgi:phospholipase C
VSDAPSAGPPRHRAQRTGPASTRPRRFLLFVAVMALAVGAVVWVRSSGQATSAGQATTGLRSIPGSMVITNPSSSAASGSGGSSSAGGATSAAPSQLDLARQKIKHIVFVVKENRSYDNYFGAYPEGDGATTAKLQNGSTVPLTRGPDLMANICHDFFDGLRAVDGGKMDGFDTICLSDEGTFTTYKRDQIPAYWAYADRFTLADRFFTSMYSPTFPEHLYLIAAQAYGIVNNKSTPNHPGVFCDDPTEYAPKFRDDLTPAELARIMKLEDHAVDAGVEGKIRRYMTNVRSCFDIKTIMDELDQKHISWRYYTTEAFWSNTPAAIKHIRYSSMYHNVKEPDQFLTDVKDGTLPAVTWLNPEVRYSEHPGFASVCAGQNYTVDIMNALQRSRYWKNTVVVMVWDDFGGTYDHVPPPHLDVMGLGPRTPALIMSPYSKPGSNPDGGSVDSTTYEFSSVLRFIEDLYGLKRLTKRDANTNSVINGLDMTKPNFKPLILQPKSC